LVRHQGEYFVTARAKRLRAIVVAAAAMAPKTQMAEAIAPAICVYRLSREA
jgi:hypothetical protein